MIAGVVEDGSAFRRYLAETKTPFAVLINYGAANFASDRKRKRPGNFSTAGCAINFSAGFPVRALVSSGMMRHDI